jgi:hypothetical protein
VTLPVRYGITNNTTLATGESIQAAVALSTSDTIISAHLTITTNHAKSSLHLLNVPGEAVVDVTTGMGGPWTLVPIKLDVTPVLVCRNIVGSQGQAVLIVENEGAASTVEIHLEVICLR